MVDRDPATHVGAVVKIDGVEISCDADSLDPGILSGLKVTWGRQDRITRPAASTCDFQIVDPDGGSDYASVIRLNSTVEVLAVMPDASRLRVFFGDVTDLALSHEPDGGDAVLDVTCVDTSARLSAKMVGDEPWPAGQTNGQRRTTMIAAIGGSTAVYWPAFRAAFASSYTMAGLDVDNRAAWDLIADFLWGIATVAWPIAYGPTGRPGLFMTGQKVLNKQVLGVIDERENQAEPVGMFWTDTSGSVADPSQVPVVCLDACDIDLEGTTFKANPAEVNLTMRLTWVGIDNEGTFTQGASSRLFEFETNVRQGDAGPAGAWGNLMPTWSDEFDAPWGVEAVRVDPDSVTAMNDFHLAMTRLLEQTTRINHSMLLQNLPTWTPWRDAKDHSPEPNVCGLLQGGVYEFRDGRWILDLNLSMDDPLKGDLAPIAPVYVRPGDVVEYPHDTTKVTLIADPDTMWPVGVTATFTDGPYGWDGAAWVAGGVRPVYVHPGDTPALAHDDTRVAPSPYTPWTAGQYATFTDGAYQWSGSAWVAMVMVKAGDTVALSHDAPSVLPSPTTAWPGARYGGYATFSDGMYRWDGAAWAAVIVVSPGDTVDTAPGDANVQPSPTTPWQQGQYANFLGVTPNQRRWTGTGWQSMIVVKPGGSTTAGPDDPRLIPEPTTPWGADEYATLAGDAYRWSGSAWVAWLPAVKPGDTVDAPHDDPAVRPEPTTPWTAGQYATFTDGAYQWSGSAWVAMVTVKAGDTSTLPHDASTVLPEPTDRWGVDDYATFSDGRWRWTGEAWVAYAIWTVARTNLHPDPRALTMGVGTRPIGAAVVPTNVDTGAPDGRSLRRFTFTSGPTSGTGTGYLGNRTDAVEQIPVMPGETVTWAVWAHANRPTQLRAEIVWHTTGSTLVSSNNTAMGDWVTLDPDTWTRLTLTVPAHPDAGNGAPRLAYVASASTPITAGQIVDVAERLFEDAVQALPYFDGGTPSTEAEDYSWTGPADASASIMRVPGVVPGSVVDAPHDDGAVQPNPTTAWADDIYATFSDGTWRWDGTAWAVWTAPIIVTPGSTVGVAHDDPAVQPDPTTAWPVGQWATFTDGAFQWDGQGWADVSDVAVEAWPGEAYGVASTDAWVRTPGVPVAWPWDNAVAATSAKFSDGVFQWRETEANPGGYWVKLFRFSTLPGQIPRWIPVPHDDAMVSNPQGSANGVVALFSDGPREAADSAWVPTDRIGYDGATVPYAHDDPAVVAIPQVPWPTTTTEARGHPIPYVTFTDGTYRWDGAAWVAYTP